MFDVSFRYRLTNLSSQQWYMDFSQPDAIETVEPVQLDSNITIGSNTCDSLSSPEICVVCLDLLGPTLSNASNASSDSPAPRWKYDNSSEAVTALPCNHASFHLTCLGTWLNHARVCPICKSQIRTLRICRPGGLNGTELIPVSESLDSLTVDAPTASRLRRQSRRHRRPKPPSTPSTASPTHHFRRQLYTHSIPSLYLGNGIARDPKTHRRHPLRLRYSTPTAFTSAPPEIHRLASTWIRRELSLFDFLSPSSSSPLITPHSQRRKPTTAPFLHAYILAIVRAMDLRGSGGQAVALIAEYLGACEARLFVHELAAVLDSGCAALEEWDAQVRYWWDVGGVGEIRDGRGAVVGRIED
jgi:hypothetical protein